MLRTVTDADAVKTAQETFARLVEKAAARTETLQLGFQGGGLEATTHVLSDLGIWAAISRIDRRYWNAFGVGDPRKDDRSIVVEINPPVSGVDRRVSGLFLKDSDGAVYLAHRGRVGGGRKGIGKEAFRDWYPVPFTTVDDDGETASVILIGCLGDEDFLQRLADFTRLVATFKREATTGKLGSRPSVSPGGAAGRKIVLISCSSKKLPRAALARDLYQGTLFKASIAWAEQQQADAIHILSAKHHLVGIDERVEPYDLTLNDMPNTALRRWADRVLQQLEQATDLERDRFIVLAGDRYRRFLLPHLKHAELPLEGMRIGEQVQFLQQQVAAPYSSPMTSEFADCAEIHRHLAALPRFHFPFDSAAIPENGIYILFESGEYAHGTDRIVRIGTHRGDGQLPSRLREHFLTENKDRSIFRKNIGRALLHRDRSPLARDWEIDLTTREARERHGTKIDHARIEEVERQVSAYMRSSLSFAVFEVPERTARLRLEAGLIASVNRCEACSPSPDWLGNHSSKPRIAESGLWLVQGLDAEPLTRSEWAAIKQSQVEQLAPRSPKDTDQQTDSKHQRRGRPKGSKNMSKKYAPLETDLRSSAKGELSLTFKEIEGILGAPLPRSARDLRSWWSNPSDIRSASQQAAWLNAGFRVASVSLGANGWVRFERVGNAKPAAPTPPAVGKRRHKASTHGGRRKDFEWRLNGQTLRVENSEGREHAFELCEIVAVLGILYKEFGSNWFPLANNVEKLYHEEEQTGLGSVIYNQPGADTLHAQGASYLGVVLEAVGILEWNGEARGIAWRILSLPLSPKAVARALSAR